jgi:hypothetical protein
MEWNKMRLPEYKPLLDPNPNPGAGGGGGTATWRDSLPEDIRADPLLMPVKDVNELAKTYVHAQRMLGNRIPKPSGDWKPEQWNDFWNGIGRPADHTKYKTPEYQFPEGFPAIDKGKMDAALKHFHGLGFTQPQLEGVLKFYYDDLTSAHKTEMEARKGAHATVMQKLEQHFGGADQMNANLERARNAIRKLAGEGENYESLVGFITEKGLDNNFEFLTMMSKVGEMMEEDRAKGGATSQGFAPNAAAALSELAKLDTDDEFQKALHDARAPGHKEAVARQLQLLGIAHPGKHRE